jgi:hypothetical protein
MAELHMVNLALKRIERNGNVTEGEPSPNQDLLVTDFTTEHRVVHNPNVPNSDGWPTMEDYLVAEARDGFIPVHIDQYMIVTVKE